jgi:hypothetical protein
MLTTHDPAHVLLRSVAAPLCSTRATQGTHVLHWTSGWVDKLCHPSTTLVQEHSPVQNGYSDHIQAHQA